MSISLKYRDPSVDELFQPDGPYLHSELVCCGLKWPSPSPSSLLRILHAHENEVSLSSYPRIHIPEYFTG